MSFNLDAVLQLFNIAAVLGSGALNVYFFLKSKSDKRFEELDQALAEYDLLVNGEIRERKEGAAEFDNRLVKLETEFESAPGHKDLEQIRQTLSELGSTLSAVKERSMNTLQATRRIEQHLLERFK